VVPVFFGTDRSRRDQPKRIGYGTDRAHKLEVGRALVTVPKAHQVPNVERPWAIKIPYTSVVLYQQDEDPKKHFTIQELKSLSKEKLLALIRDRLRASRSFQDQALVFVHGYNNGFDAALFRTAQIAYDLKYDGAPFLYSWPSGAGIAGYPYDRESAQQAEPFLQQFLLMVLKETGAKNVSIIAHSMGNQLLLQVLRNLDRNNPEVARINQNPSRLPGSWSGPPPRSASSRSAIALGQTGSARHNSNSAFRHTLPGLSTKLRPTPSARRHLTSHSKMSLVFSISRKGWLGTRS
jgi:esterase/lipase superfamily enzyme